MVIGVSLSLGLS